MTRDADGPPLDVTTFNAEQRDGCDTLAPVVEFPCWRCGRAVPLDELEQHGYQCEDCDGRRDTRR